MENLTDKIENSINAKIKPYIISHNGNIIFHEYKDGIVYVTLTGACVTCPFSAMTLKLGVLEILQKELLEIKDVELVEMYNNN